MSYVSKNVLEKELFYDGTLILKYHIEYPSINISVNQNAAIRFNNYNKNLALKIQNRTETEIYNNAVETYKYNKANGYPIMIFEVYRNFIITYERLNILSLYTDEYIFSGGAHGNTVRNSQTWDLLIGTMIKLDSFFPNNPYFLIDVLKQINEQIAKEPDIYFDNTCNLVLDTFNPNSFYLTSKGIAIYFQQYDIAPYSSGIREFIII